ncbi:MAG: ORF6N domain-containing protein [Burkholderiales bacterium]|nr:ORF6N domain-containing protein [Burkholderiales bacterium]
MRSRGTSKKTNVATFDVNAQIARQILVIRGQKVMIDTDLAALYGVTTKRFNEQVKRNLARFPADFFFRLSDAEYAALRSHIATSTRGRGGRRYLPYVFTEHGAIMAATILDSPRATEMSVFIVRAFVALREALAAHKDLAQRLDELESRLERKLATHDQAISGILEAIRQLMVPPEPAKKRRIGFVQTD